jgi:hypothetical protein
VLNLVRNNFTLKVVSVCLALAAWGYFHLAAAPGTTARFEQNLSVPIVAVGLRPGFQANYPQKYANIVVEVPRNGTAVKPETFQAVLDVADFGSPGIYNVQVKIVPPDDAIKQLSPPFVNVTLDRIEQRTVPVSLNYVGDGRSVVVESAHVNPTTTTIRGVASEIARVTGVRVAIPIPAKPQQFDAMLKPAPTDAHGSEIDGILVSPDHVRVRANFVAPSAGKR